MALFRTKWGVALYFVCLLPSLGRLVLLLIMLGAVDLGSRSVAGRMPQAMDDMNPHRAAFYFEGSLSTMPGMIFFLLLTSVVVSRCVARDRATNALELYWTRGISPWGYVFAKWLGGFLVTASLTVGMPIVLHGDRNAFDPRQGESAGTAEPAGDTPDTTPPDGIQTPEPTPGATEPAPAPEPTQPAEPQPTTAPPAEPTTPPEPTPTGGTTPDAQPPPAAPPTPVPEVPDPG